MRTWIVASFVSATALLAQPAWAEEMPPAPPPQPPAYQVVGSNCDPCCLTCPRWTLSLGVWAWTIDGDVGAGGPTASVESDLGDTFEELELAWAGRLQYAVRNWRFQLGAFAGTLEDSIELGGVSDVAELNIWSVQATAGYVLAGGRTDCSPCAGTWCLDAYAGLRYWDVEIDGPGAVGAAPGLDVDDQWVDPIVGLHLEVLWQRWAFVAEADIGGFGLGSEFSWSAMAAVGYRLNRDWGIHLGWRVLDVDRDENDFDFDATLSGPFLALSVTF